MKSFDEIRELLANQGPEAVEAYRQQMVESVIQSADPDRQQKLRQLQWKVMGIVRKHTPTSSMLKISELMMIQFHDLNAALNGLLPELQTVSTNITNLTKLDTVK